MKKLIIGALVVALGVTCTAFYVSADTHASKKVVTTTEEKPTTTEKKESSTTETTEKVEPTIEENESEIDEKEPISDENDTDSTDSDDVEESEEEDPEEIDAEEQENCNHEWTDPSYAYDSERGYVLEETCSKCDLLRFTPISQEEYDAATGQDQTTDDSEDTTEADQVEENE